ncbi:MAG: serine protease, partial [Pseudonocardiaceae bacterium]
MATPQDHDADRLFVSEAHGAPPSFGSRPPRRYAVDPAQAHAFGRPAGVTGAFAAQSRGDVLVADGASRELTAVPPPPEALAAAFGRPPGSAERLQRPPGRGGAIPREEHLGPPGAGADPWRDPGAAVVLGAPALVQN